ncbi:malonic semialdehyde reductase [Sanguibacter sp. HDW7]|uniref:malonic semialdehyde reductase n=1 Tax=Sanguibacter sp. HDW7 TaxID=2714931 RepID=UPI00140A34D3|nr:malonic semialdehyde reductase [Sanguibacter sp. HDW7]QIK82774.1 malonic semialdehyde reductase [Sanguibacter sp. HDW7]
MTTMLDSDATTLSIDDATADLLFREARTVKRFTDEEVTDEHIAAAYDLMRWGPSAMNISPLRYLVVRGSEAKDRLNAYTMEGNHAGIQAAPVTLVLAADVDFHVHMDRLTPHAPGVGAHFASQPELSESMGRMNAALQAGYFITALRAAGLQVGPMGIADSAALDADLLAGTAWKSLFLVNVGHAVADAEGATRPRAARLEAHEVSRVL